MLAMIIDRRRGLPPVTNQQSEPRCVGEAFATLMSESGYSINPDTVYVGAKRYDSIPGEDYDGTHLEGAVRYLHAETPYDDRIYPVDTKSIPIIIEALKKSCVVCSVRADMLLGPGHEDSYHAMIICGYDSTQDTFLLRNSWGITWGLDGYMWISTATFLDYSNRRGWALGVDEKRLSRKKSNKKMLMAAGVVGTIALTAAIYYTITK